MEHYAGLCIGGPFDGRTYVGKRENGPFLNVSQLPEIDFRLPPKEPDTPVQPNVVVYQFDRLRAPPSKESEGEDFCIWRPQGQSLADTIRMLLNGYHPVVPLKLS